MPPVQDILDSAPWLWYLLVVLALAGVAALVLGAVYLRRRASRRALRRRIAELESLREAGRRLVESELDLEALCALIAEQAGQVINNEGFQVGLFSGPVYEILFWRIGGKLRPTPARFDISESPTLVGWVRDHRRPILINHLTHDIDKLPVRPRQVSEDPVLSAVFLPLISGGQVLGILSAQHPDPYRFSAEDIERLSIIANQAAAAIRNALLYAQAKSRAADLEMVSYIGREVNQLQNLDALFAEVVRLTQERLGFHPINIMGVDPKSGDAVLRASSIAALEPGALRLPSGQGLIGNALATRQTVLANNVSEDERYISAVGVAAYDVESERTRAEIAIPLLVDREVVGVLDVQSTRVGGFTAREIAVLDALALEVASALRKTQQLALQTELSWVATAQLQVAEAINAARSLEALADAIARLTVLLVGVDECAVLLYDEEMGLYRVAALHGVSAETADRFRNHALLTGRWTPLDAMHLGQIRIDTERPPPWHGAAAATPVSLFPIARRDQPLGALVVSRPRAWPGAAPDAQLPDTAQRRRDLLNNIIEQTSQALERFRLVTAQQEEAWVNAALLQVSEAVNSDIDLNRILDTIVRLVPLLVGVRACLILTYDRQTDAFYAGPSYGLSAMGRGLVETTPFDPSEFPAMQVRENDQRSPQSMLYRLRLPAWLQRVFESDMADAVPLYARGVMVGMLLVGPTANGRPIAGRRQSILNGIAQQAATAVMNSQLYRESAERDRLDQEIEVARAIQASLIPQTEPEAPNTDIVSYWRAARQVSGDFFDFFPFDDDRLGIVVADVADKGVPAALFMALSRTIVRSVAFNRIEPAPTLARANTIIYGDTASDLFVTVFYALWHSATRTLTYANGGHNPPLLIRADGSAELLTGHGIALGVLQHISFDQQQVELAPGDTLIMYTDGVTEAVNEAYAEFGLRRLQLVAQANHTLPAAGIADAITDALRDHAGPAPPTDDTTFVILKAI